MKVKQELRGKIGLEIHVYPVTCEKLFCRCRASRERGLKENSLVCPICVGEPGAKPMLPNKKAVEVAVKVGLMLGCRINSFLKWQRKHYDWPDLPKGYQNTLSGPESIPVGVEGKFGGIGIWSMHLEEDPASWNPETGCVDYNRSGLPLLEIVTAPEFDNSEQVINWLKRLIQSLAYLKAADTNAGIKVDVNVNLVGGGKDTQRVEIKNINSIESIGKAIEYELDRQRKEGSEMETRRFDPIKGKTVRMRSKEDAEDYRFISDPDLQDIFLDNKFVSDLKKDLPESPEEKLNKMLKKYKIGKSDAEVLTKNIDIAEFFEEVVSFGVKPGFALPWVSVELLGMLNYNKKRLDEIDIIKEHFVDLLKLVEKGEITELQGKEALRKFKDGSFDVAKSIKGKGKIDDKKDLKKVIEKIIKKNKVAVEDYKKGEKKSFNFLMGQIMKETDRRADFRVASKILVELLKS
jgi:aspartyl-tRNA(Asn)/glutamyl-tRNA(Gln) amidotransferase subunit B